MKKKLLTGILLLNTTLYFSQSVLKTMKRLPDTGQNTSYTGTFGEDNDYSINTPFFIDNGNGTVTDTITGLIWQKSDGGEMTIENAITYCSNLILGSETDWRLPNAHELFSIMNLQYSNPSLDASVFTTTTAQYWWSIDKQVNDITKIWATNAGGGIGNHPKTETISAGGNKKFHVRAVRNPITPVVVQSHFTDNGNGTITDNITNLIWEKTPFADTLSWEQSLIYANTLTLTGKTDWRLPNIKELQSINDETLINPSLNTNYFNINGAKKYWSSTTLPNQTSNAWYMYTQFGITTYDTKTNKHNLICVRSNQLINNLNEINSSKLSLYPNPFSNKITLKNALGNENFELYNSFGQLIFSGKNIDQQNFDCLINGIYFLKITSQKTSIIKLLKE
jgi:hypothetical protein